MHRLILKELKSRFGYVILSMFAYEMCIRVFETYDYLEYSYFLVPIVCCGLLFRNECETELIKTSNTNIADVMLVRYIITYIYMMIYPAVRLLSLSQNQAFRDIISLTTTVLFCTSISVLYRVIVNNPYATVMYSVFTHTILSASFKLFLGDVIKITDPRLIERISPFESHKITNMARFYNNRMYITGAAITIIALSYLLMRRKTTFNVE